MYKKVKDNRGGSLIIVLFALVLISLTMLTIYSQINNQIRLNANSSQKIEDKVIAESGIDECISEYIKEIEIEEDFYNPKDIALNLALLYAQESVDIFSNQGNKFQLLNDLIDFIKGIIEGKDGPTVNEIITDMQNIIEGKKGYALNGNPKTNNIVKDHLANSKLYLELYSKEQIISNIVKNLDYLKYDLDFNTQVKYDSNNIQYTSSIEDLLKDINTNNLKIYSNIDIYIDKIDIIINNWEINEWTEDFLSDKKVSHDKYGNNSSNIQRLNIAKNRLVIIKEELKLLKILCGEGMTDEDPSDIINNVRVRIPVKIEESSKSNKSNIQCDINQVNMDYSEKVVSNGIEKYEFKIQDLTGNSSIIVPLILVSETKNIDDEKVYDINAEIKLQLNNIVSSNDYEIKYEIVKWNE